MRIRYSLTVAAFAAALGGLVLPALAQAPGGAGSAPDQGMGRMEGGSTGHSMMGGGMMGGGCAGMMQSMQGGGRPNSQWHAHPPGGVTPD